MKTFYLSCVIVASLFVFCQANSIGVGKDVRSPRTRREIKKIETINAMMDLLTKEIHPTMKTFELDPFKAPDQYETIYAASLELKSILISNMSTIKRDGDVEVLDDEPGRILTFKVRLGFDDLQFNSNYKGTFVMLLASMGHLQVKLPDLIVEFIIEVNFQDLTVRMTHFKMDNSKTPMVVHFSGNLESHLINLFNFIVVRIVDGTILWSLQNPLMTQVNNALAIANDLIQKTLKSFE